MVRNVLIDVGVIALVGYLVGLCCLRIRNQSLSDSELSMQQVNLLPILLLILIVTLCATNDLSFRLLILLVLLFD